MEEMVQMTTSGMRAGVELTAEMLKILLPYLGQVLKSVGKGGMWAIGKVGDAVAEGTVTRKNLLLSAEKANCGVKVTDNFPSECIEDIVAQAKVNKIPIAINGEGATRSVSFRECDSDVMVNILSNIHENLLRRGEGTQAQESFVVNKADMDAVKTQLETNGVECFFVQSDGDIRCVFNSQHKEKVKDIMTEFNNDREKISKNFVVGVVENERMREIKQQISDINAARNNSEQQKEFYKQYAEDESLKFPAYSEANMKLALKQMPDGTKFAGKDFWTSIGITVDENAKGVEINAPQTDDNGNPVLDENGKQTFTKTLVYDVSETNAYNKYIDSEVADLQRQYDVEKAAAFKTSENKSIVLSDVESGKSFEVTVGNNLLKSDIVVQLQQQFDYDVVEANHAANKLASDLELNEKYFQPPSPNENIDKLMINIRYPSDGKAIRDVTFNTLKNKNADDPIFINVGHGENQVLIAAADKLSDDDMKQTLKDNLGLNDLQAEQSIEKIRKIDGQMRSRVQETVYSRDNALQNQTLHIERVERDVFTVTSGDKSKTYNISAINVTDKIMKDFSIPAENAQHIVNKAQSQSVIQNKIRNSKEQKRKSDKVRSDPLKSQNQTTSNKRGSR